MLVRLKRNLRGVPADQLYEGVVLRVYEPSINVHGGVWVECRNFRYAELAPDDFEVIKESHA